jgi:hypothetical protein
MCDSATELTEVGVEQKKKDAETEARWPFTSVEDEESTEE